MPSRALRLARRRHQHDGLAELHQHGATGLLGDPSGLETQSPAVKVGLNLLEHLHSPRGDAPLR